MKSKGLTSVLALLFGSAGAHRFYLGQTNRGWIYLLVFWFIIPAAVWSAKYFKILYYWESLYFGWIGILFLIHVVESIYFVALSNEKFRLADKSRGNTWLLTLFSVFIACTFAYGVNYLFSLSDEIDIDKAEAEFTLSSLAYSESLFQNEEVFRKQYAGKVLQIDGEVISLGTDFTEGNFIILESAQNTSIDLKCFFNEAHQKQLEKIQRGMQVNVKGVCNGRFLENCTVTEFSNAPEIQIPVHTNSDSTGAVQ